MDFFPHLKSSLYFFTEPLDRIYSHKFVFVSTRTLGEDVFVLPFRRSPSGVHVANGPEVSTEERLGIKIILSPELPRCNIKYDPRSWLSE